MKVHLKRIDDAYRIEAKSVRGDLVHIDASAALGTQEEGWRPMELLLVSLATCSAIDIISILKKQRQKIYDLSIEVSGDRKAGVPSPFTSIQLHFTASGNIKPNKMNKAIELTKTQLCSVFFSLHPDIEVTYTYEIDSP